MDVAIGGLLSKYIDKCYKLFLATLTLKFMYEIFIGSYWR